MPGWRSASGSAGHLNAKGEPLPPRDPNTRLKRRHFLARALAPAAILALSGCDAPTFDRDTISTVAIPAAVGGIRSSMECSGGPRNHRERHIACSR